MFSLKDVKNRKDIGIALNYMGLTGLGAEIGVAYGENAFNILAHSELKKLYLIDVWETQSPDVYIDGSQKINFEEALKYCKNLLSPFNDRIEYIKKYSDDAAKLFAPETFDFVYLDGCHHNPQFQRDLDNWFPLVKKGGIFGGHDFYTVNEDYYRCEVEETVKKFVKDHSLSLYVSDECTSWWIIKPF